MTPSKATLITRLTFAFLVLSFGSLVTYAQAGDTAENNYIQARNSILKQLKGHEVSDQENSEAVKKLDSLIQAAVGPIRIKGFSENWHSNVQTFQDEVGVGRADGVENEIPGTIAFVSTPKILSAFLGRNNFDFKEASKNENLLSLAVTTDAALTPYFDVPVKLPKGITQAHALVALEAQDIGPYEPHSLIVVATRRNQVFIINQELKGIQTQIPACNHAWTQQNKLADAAYTKYKKSNLQDQKAINEYHRLEEAAFKSYRDCFQSKAKLQAFFPEIEKRATATLGRID